MRLPTPAAGTTAQKFVGLVMARGIRIYLGQGERLFQNLKEGFTFFDHA